MIEVLVTMATLGIAALVAHRLTGFSAQHHPRYAALKPAFDIRRHLVGPLLCEGVIYGPTGRVTSRFVAEMQGHWQGNRGILDEHFRYASGETQQRQWRLTLGNDGAISVEADDLQGPVRGQQAGAGLRLRYRIRLPDHAGGWVLDVTDWMYLMENGTIISRGQFRKFGFKVAELVATMRRVEA